MQPERQRIGSHIQAYHRATLWGGQSEAALGGDVARMAYRRTAGVLYSLGWVRQGCIPGYVQSLQSIIECQLTA